jgi:hypothetical protein
LSAAIIARQESHSMSASPLPVRFRNSSSPVEPGARAPHAAPPAAERAGGSPQAARQTRQQGAAPAVELLEPHWLLAIDAATD